jgi:OPT family oligopeptide transporter
MPKFSFLGMQKMSAETVGCFSDVSTTERNAGKLQEVHNSEEVLEEEVSSSPIIEEVAFTVATVDDPTLACLTFRTVVLGVGGNMLLTIVNTFFGYRKEPLHISAISIQIVALPLGHLMAKLLPRKSIQLVLPGLITNRDGRRWWSWGFSLNPGPFTMKEHVLITVFANTGGGAAATIVVNVVKAFYKQRMDFMPSLIFVVATQVRSSEKTLLLLHESLHSFMLLLKLSSLSFDLKLQLLGYGFAGLYRRVLVEPAHMWWPHTLVQVSLFRFFSLSSDLLLAAAACLSSPWFTTQLWLGAKPSWKYPKLLNPSRKTQDVL